MRNLKWFSAKMRFALMVEEFGANTLNECLFLFKAGDFVAATKRAIEIGYNKETIYRTFEGKRVQWRFVEIISLDVISSTNLDGAEIYSDPIHLDIQDHIPYDAQFSPDSSKPIQTI